MRLFGKHTIRAGSSFLPAVLLLCFLLTGCGIRDTQISAREANGTTGHEKAEKTPERFGRVIALSKSNAELWILAGGSLIATSDDAMDIAGLNSDAISLGDMDHVSLEAVTALDPDLVILFSTDPAQKSLGEACEEIGLNVYYTNIDSFDDYDAAMKELTGFTGRTENYASYVTDIRSQIEDVKNKVPKDGSRGTYLLLRVSKTKIRAAKNDFFSCEIFNDLGLSNIAADDSAFDELSMEAIIAADPDYIFVVPRNDDDSVLDHFRELFIQNPGWEKLSAVSEGNYYLLPRDRFSLKPNAEWGQVYEEAFDLLYGE